MKITTSPDSFTLDTSDIAMTGERVTITAARRLKKTLNLRRDGYQTYSGSFNGCQVRIRSEEVVAHGTFPVGKRQQRQKQWTVYVSGERVGEISSLAEARKLAYKTCLRPHTETGNAAAQSPSPSLATPSNVVSSGARSPDIEFELPEIFDAPVHFGTEDYELALRGEARPVVVTAMDRSAERIITAGILEKVTEKYLKNTEGPATNAPMPQEENPNQLQFWPRASIKTFSTMMPIGRQANITSVDSEGDVAAVRLGNIKKGDRVRFKDGFEAEMGDGIVTVEPGEIADVTGVLLGGPSVFVRCPTTLRVGDSVRIQPRVLQVPAEHLELLTDSGDERTAGLAVVAVTKTAKLSQSVISKVTQVIDQMTDETAAFQAREIVNQVAATEDIMEAKNLIKSMQIITPLDANDNHSREEADDERVMSIMKFLLAEAQMTMKPAKSQVGKTAPTVPGEVGPDGQRVQMTLQEFIQQSTANLQKIYELEYKHAMLSGARKQGPLADRAEMTMYQIRTDLDARVNAELKMLAEAFDDWVDESATVYGNEGNEDIIANITALLGELQRPPQALNQRIVLMHKVLTTAHHNASMASFAYGLGRANNEQMESDIMGMLTGLSNSDTSKWDAEIKRLLSLPKGGSRAS